MQNKDFLSIPKCVKRFLATVRSFWSWAFRLSSSSRARLVWRTPTVTLQRKTNSVSSTSNATTYLMFWRFLWMLNDWSWGFRIAQMHLDWIRFACLRSFNFFGGENIFATFCMHLRNDVLSDFIQAGSQYHLDCKYLSSQIIRLCHHDHYLFIMM